MFDDKNYLSILVFRFSSDTDADIQYAYGTVVAADHANEKKIFGGT